MTEELDKLKEKLAQEYKRQDLVVVQKDIAILERQVWALARAEFHMKGEPVPRKEHYFRDEIKSPDQISVNVRSNILALGPWADVLWDKVHKRGIALRVAYKLGLHAKKMSESRGIPPDAALKQVMQEYYANTYTARGKQEGVIYRRRRPEPRNEELEEVHPDDWDPDVEDSRKFRGMLRTLTERFVDARLRSLDEAVRKDLSRDFEFEIRVIYEDLLRKIRNLKRDEDVPDVIAFSSVVDACHCLGVNPPRRGQAVDELRAREAYRRLAARFHPDRNRGEDKLLKQYHAVNEAWQLITKYNETIQE